MRALDRKLLRDLRRVWAQTLAIAAVLSAGIMMLVSMQMTQRTLDGTRQAYYDRSRFGEVFVGASRAPRAIMACGTRRDDACLRAATTRMAFDNTKTCVPTSR